MPFTLRNIKEDLEDIGFRFDAALGPGVPLGDQGARARDIRPELPASRRAIAFRTGTRNKKQERRCTLVLRGSGRMKVDDEIVELTNGTRCASRPVRGEATRPGRRASRSWSLARPISARLRAKMSMASATGGLTSRAVRTVRRTTLTQSAPRDPDSLHSPRPARRDGAGRGPWGRDCRDGDRLRVRRSSGKRPSGLHRVRVAAVAPVLGTASGAQATCVRRRRLRAARDLRPARGPSCRSRRRKRASSRAG